MQLHRSSPHAHQARTTSELMRCVIYATFPGVAVMVWAFGWGVVINLLLASIFALIIEGAVVYLRQRKISYYLSDYSAVLTAILLALALPPSSPWWLTLIGVAFAIIFGKQLYGGLGNNPFNPAMLGYVLLLISFPIQMTSWIPANSIASHALSFSDGVSLIFAENKSVLSLATQTVDGLTSATPLDALKTAVKLGQPASEYTSTGIFGSLAGLGWEYVNLAFLLGGIYLVLMRAIAWQISFSFLASLTVISLIFYTLDNQQYASPLFHLFSGGTMLGAFFIATDPVTAATSNKGRLMYGMGIGVLIYIIRTWGGYPDAIAFAVLLMNIVAPTLDFYTKPRTYGHS